MPSLLGWVGALGAWLLFAGPIYQAALELDAEEVERDELAALADAVDQPARISSWWWLLPPVGYVLNLRRRRVYRKAAFDAMSPTLRRQFVTFADKAAGWALVAAGALLLAVVDTANLGAELAWPPAVTIVVMLALALLAASYTAGRMRRRHEMLGERRDRPARAGRRG